MVKIDKKEIIEWIKIKREQVMEGYVDFDYSEKDEAIIEIIDELKEFIENL